MGAFVENEGRTTDLRFLPGHLAVPKISHGRVRQVSCSNLLIEVFKDTLNLLGIPLSASNVLEFAGHRLCLSSRFHLARDLDPGAVLIALSVRPLKQATWFGERGTRRRLAMKSYDSSFSGAWRLKQRQRRMLEFGKKLLILPRVIKSLPSGQIGEKF